MNGHWVSMYAKLLTAGAGRLLCLLKCHTPGALPPANNIRRRENTHNLCKLVCHCYEQLLRVSVACISLKIH